MAACDPTTIEGAPFYTDADSVLYGPRYSLDGLGKEGFDFRTGRFFASRLDFHGTRLMDVRGSDTYWIHNAPSGIPIPLHVELLIDAELGVFSPCPACYCTDCNSHMAHLDAGMRDSKGGSDSVSVCGCWPVTRSFGLDLTVLPDEVFDVWYTVEAQIGIGASLAAGSVEARIHFAGVPAGAQLVSCHGVNDEAVAALPSTWGSLKARYR